MTTTLHESLDSASGWEFSDGDSGKPALTIFSVLKPFDGLADLHQRNAITSWAALACNVEVLLFSDSQIPSDIREQFNCFPCESINEFGTPLLDDVFRAAARHAHGQIRAYVNADILLDHRFVDAALALGESDSESWLAIGQRTELDIRQSISVGGSADIDSLFDEAMERGSLNSIVCKDYFMFPDHMFREIPPFAIGRGNWDNWMVAHAKELDVPVIDITSTAPVIHQKHDYPHVVGGRMSAYVRGPEAQHNERLAGGRRLITGSTANHKLHRGKIQRLSRPLLSIGRDWLRFTRLLLGILFSRR